MSELMTKEKKTMVFNNLRKRSDTDIIKLSLNVKYFLGLTEYFMDVMKKFAAMLSVLDTMTEDVLFMRRLKDEKVE